MNLLPFLPHRGQRLQVSITRPDPHSLATKLQLLVLLNPIAARHVEKIVDRILAVRKVRD